MEPTNLERWVGQTAEHLKQIDDRLEEMQEWQDVHDRDERLNYETIKIHMATNAQQLTKLTNIELNLVGNGKPGLLSRVDHIEWELKLARWVLVSVSLAVLGLVLDLLRHWLIG